MRFIRRNGRIIPIRDKKSANTAKAIVKVAKLTPKKVLVLAGLAGTYWTWKNREQFAEDVADKALDTI